MINNNHANFVVLEKNSIMKTKQSQQKLSWVGQKIMKPSWFRSLLFAIVAIVFVATVFSAEIFVSLFCIWNCNLCALWEEDEEHCKKTCIEIMLTRKIFQKEVWSILLSLDDFIA